MLVQHRTREQDNRSMHGGVGTGAGHCITSRPGRDDQEEVVGLIFPVVRSVIVSHISDECTHEDDRGLSRGEGQQQPMKKDNVKLNEEWVYYDGRSSGQEQQQ